MRPPRSSCWLTKSGGGATLCGGCAAKSGGAATRSGGRECMCTGYDMRTAVGDGASTIYEALCMVRATMRGGCSAFFGGFDTIIGTWVC
ncbi:MAG: hypothetical protein GC178_06135 [Flavobacteriales bacterium]|nr:hypothetical protein [Flavobacteriales bacterium]